MANVSCRSFLTLAEMAARGNTRTVKRMLPALSSLLEMSTLNQRSAPSINTNLKSKFIVPYRNLQTLARTATETSTEETVFGELKIHKVTETDFNEVLALLIRDFVYTEPHNSAIDFTVQDALPLFKYLLKIGIDSKTTYGLKNEKNEFVALRLTSIKDRPIPGQKLEEPELNVKELSDKARLICDLVDALEAKLWTSLKPEVKRLLYLIVISVRKDYARRGLAYKLMHYNIEEAISLGCQGWVSEGTAYSSQKMFEKMGFVTLYELKDEDHLDENGKRIFYCEPPTVSSKLVFKPF